MSIRSALRRPASGRRDNLTSIVHERWQRGVVNAVGIGGVWIFAAWKVPMGLPGLAHSDG